MLWLLLRCAAGAAPYNCSPCSVGEAIWRGAGQGIGLVLKEEPGMEGYDEWCRCSFSLAPAHAAMA